MTKAAAIPFIFLPSGELSNPQYKVLIEPELLDFPSADEVADATRTNFIIEQQLRSCLPNICGFIVGLRAAPKVMTVFTNLYGRRKDS